VPSIHDTYGSRYLKALENDPNTGKILVPKEGRSFTITGVEVKAFDDGRKILVSFRESEKQLVCNRTNANIIAELHGEDTDDWYGKRITLYATKVDFSGKRVDAIRVKEEIPAPPVKIAQRPNANPEAMAEDEGDQEIPF
jgi:hypothetical protein